MNNQTRIAALYNPHNQNKQQLINSFVARQNTFKNLFKAIKEAKMEVPEQHYLLLGHRGMGKTTLLLRLAYEVENDPDLNTWLVPLVFNEEEYSVRRLFKFWERIMDLLEEKLPELRFEPAERQRLSQQHKDDDAYERALFDWLAAELTRTGRKLLLFIDNFGDMARKLTDGEAHRLRKILQTSADIRIIAASAVVLEAFYDYAHPFYEFFKVQELRGLNPTETRDLLLKLSEHYKKEAVARIVREHPGRVEALRRITGGVIRTIILLFEIFSDDEDGSAFKELEVVLDRATPLYKHRMDDLSDQQQTIVEAIALNWDGLSVKEIAEQTRLESKIISAQLHNLEKNGIIEKRATKTKNHLYLIAERFFNIWYLMRNGRRSDEKRVRWLVHFFEEWYDDDMLKRRAKQHRQALQRGDFHPEAALAYTQVFVQSPKFSAIDKHELLDTTRIFLSEKAPDLAQDLLASDLDEAYRAINLWVQGEKKKSIALLSPVYGRLFPNEKDSTKTAMFWEQEMMEIINKTGLLFYGLSEPNLTKAEQCWRWAAEQGNINAMFNHGYLFQTKRKDLDKAIEWYLKAGAKGDADAMNNLGVLFQDEKNAPDQAIEWFLKATKEGNIGAMNNLGVAFEHNKNDLEKAMEWYLKAAKKGNAPAMNNLGIVFEHKKNDLEEAIEWYLKAAEKGNAPAMNNLGIVSEYKKNDLEKAMEWYLKAAEKGNAPAMNNLGIAFEHKKNDLEKAMRWYLKAAEKGNSPAMNNLGLVFKNKKNDLEKAIEWYLKASENGNASAMNNLGVVFENKKNDLEKAIEWYLKAAEKGNAPAMNNLGVIFENKKNDLEKAIEWYLKAAEKGNAPAMNNLGVIFENKKNGLEEAIEWYLKAAEKGNAAAMLNLGRLSQKEKNNLEKAIEWYLKAAEKGNIDAMNSLAWNYFEQKIEKTQALKWTNTIVEKGGLESSLQHTAACVFAWNNQLPESKQLAQEFTQDDDYLTTRADACTTYFTLMLSKNEAQWLYELFTGESGEKVQLKDRFKPIWYAILKQLDHPDFLRMGDELAETVEEILAKAKEMTVAYA